MCYSCYIPRIIARHVSWSVVSGRGEEKSSHKCVVSNVYLCVRMDMETDGNWWSLLHNELNFEPRVLRRHESPNSVIGAIFHHV